MIKTGSLRHRITVERKIEAVNPETGYREPLWVPRVTNEPAEFKPGPGREYLASESTRSSVEGRFIIRWSPAAIEIKSSDRVLWDGRVMEVKSPPLPDETARNNLILMVGEYSTDGS